MNLIIFDIEALIRGVLIGLATGFIISAMTRFLLKIRWFNAALLGIGAALILAIILFYSWPSLIEVPELANLSRAEAELLLIKKGLIPENRPQYTSMVEAERVIPGSQDPLPGIKVPKGSVIRFGVSVSFIQSPTKTINSKLSPSISLFSPKSGEELHCIRYGDGIYRFYAKGVSKGIVEHGLQILLWVRPGNPPPDTPGWYLQRPPINGISEVQSDGRWEGIGQIGNAQWPPQHGELFDIAVTVVDSKTAQELFGEQGVVIRMGLSGITLEKALGVKVKLK